MGPLVNNGCTARAEQDVELVPEPQAALRGTVQVLVQLVEPLPNFGTLLLGFLELLLELGDGIE